MSVFIGTESLQKKVIQRMAELAELTLMNERCAVVLTLYGTIGTELANKPSCH